MLSVLKPARNSLRARPDREEHSYMSVGKKDVRMSIARETICVSLSQYSITSALQSGILSNVTSRSSLGSPTATPRTFNGTGNMRYEHLSVTSWSGNRILKMFPLTITDSTLIGLVSPPKWFKMMRPSNVRLCAHHTVGLSSNLGSPCSTQESPQYVKLSLPSYSDRQKGWVNRPYVSKSKLNY